MTQTVKNNWWKAAQSIGIGVIIFLLNGILAYQKKSYDWQIEMSNRMNNAEKINSTQDALISNRQQYEHDNDRVVTRMNDKIIFLFTHFDLNFNQN